MEKDLKFLQIKKRMNLALETLRVNDNYLLTHDINERSITHKLAEYFSQTFGKKYDVDCEYNNNLGSKKTIMVLQSELDKITNRDVTEKEYDSSIEKSVYPDIVIHKRGSDKQNLLIVEVKKSTSRIDSAYDFLKLKHYTTRDEDLGYQFGAFIKIHTGQQKYVQPEICWFSNGIELK